MWVARDKDGELSLFIDKPVRATPDDGFAIDCWDSQNDFLTINPKLFPNLKWEDEPIEVSIVEECQ